MSLRIQVSGQLVCCSNIPLFPKITCNSAVPEVNTLRCWWSLDRYLSLMISESSSLLLKYSSSIRLSLTGVTVPTSSGTMGCYVVPSLQGAGTHSTNTWTSSLSQGKNRASCRDIPKVWVHFMTFKVILRYSMISYPYDRFHLGSSGVQRNLKCCDLCPTFRTVESCFWHHTSREQWVQETGTSWNVKAKLSTSCWSSPSRYERTLPYLGLVLGRTRAGAGPHLGTQPDFRRPQYLP